MRHLTITALTLALLATAASGQDPAPPTPPRTHPVEFDSTAALGRARDLLPHVSKAEPGPLWLAFDETMRAAMGDSTRFAAMLTGIHAQLGEVGQVLSEEIRHEQGMWLYRARCKFGKAPDPLFLLIAFSPDGRVAGLAVRPDEAKEYPSTRLDYETKARLELPFRGEWFVFWGGRTLAENYHAASKSQRFALDLVIMKEGSSHTGDGTRLTDYHCYGAEIMAPAAGTIVWTRGDLPDQEPGKMDPSHPIGNGVVIDHGNGEFSLLAHLQPGSLVVKTGERVEAGALLGKCGNSGNTSEPHLHYHLQDGPEITTAEGLPAPFVHLIVDGKPVDKAEPVRGQTISRGR